MYEKKKSFLVNVHVHGIYDVNNIHNVNNVYNVNDIHNVYNVNNIHNVNNVHYIYDNENKISLVWKCNDIEKTLIKKQQDNIKYQKNKSKYEKLYHQAYDAFYQQEYNKLCHRIYNKYFQQEYNKLIQHEYEKLYQIYDSYQQKYENLYKQFKQLYCWNNDFCHGFKNNPEKNENWCSSCAKKAKNGSLLWPGVCHHCCVLLMDNRYIECPGIKSTCIRRNKTDDVSEETFNTLLLVRKRLHSNMIRETDTYSELSNNHNIDYYPNSVIDINDDNNLNNIVDQIVN